MWSKAPSTEVALGQLSKNVQVYFMQVNFFKKPNKKEFTIEPKSYTAMLLYSIFLKFFIVYLLKKKEAEKWPKVADSPLR